jgi:hypothetical protein
MRASTHINTILRCRWTYAFVDPLLDIGQKRPLQEEDLYELAEHDKVLLYLCYLCYTTPITWIQLHKLQKLLRFVALMLLL